MINVYVLENFQKSNSHTQYMDRYNSLCDKQDHNTSSMKGKKKHQPSSSDVDYVEYDNDNMSPLYSNWDQVSQFSYRIRKHLRQVTCTKTALDIFHSYRKPMSIYFHCNTILSSKLNCRAAIIWVMHSILIRYIQIPSQSTRFPVMNPTMRTPIIQIVKAIIWRIITALLLTIMVKFITMFISATSETKNRTICK